MSTYLKSAAMSLLSKTLQTFLTKYLSDVDVEGVTLPSYDGSGWGVRLSNVQLREGVILMKTMPGKVVKKRIVRRRRMRRRKPESANKKPAIPSKPKKAGERLHANGSRSEHKYTQEGTESRKHKSKHSMTQDLAADTFPRRARTNSAMSTSDFEIAATSSADYYTDEELEYDSSGEAKPTTPVQTSNSIFACFSNKNSNKGGHNNKLNDHSLHQGRQEEQPSNWDSAIFPNDGRSNGNESVQQPLKWDSSPFPVEGQSSDTASVPMIPTHPAGEIVTDEYSNDNIGTVNTNSVMEKAGHDLEEDDDDMYEYYEEEEDYEEEHELPLQLVLGEHGRIGMVDVRLIGKELHVMVEDAVITIEAIPFFTNDDKEGTHTNPNEIPSGGNQDDIIKEAEDNGEDTDSTAAGKKKSTKEPKPEPKRDTVGDRVLADNGLARLISSIPHLFLRDVWLRMIVRDEPMTPTKEDERGSTTSRPSSNTSNSANDDNNMDDYTRPQQSSKDTLVEIGIDFLSVTSGVDFLSHFQQEHTSGEDGSQTFHNESDPLDLSIRSGVSFSDSVSTKPPSLLKIPSNFVDASGEHSKNEYLVRHIRTGRGPNGGISVQLFVPNSGLSKIVTKSTVSSGDIWARQHWISSTKNHLLWCSGLDIQARIYMGTKRIDAGYSWFYGEYVEDNDPSSQIDSMVLIGGGMGTVDLPLPPPTLKHTPPIEPRMSRGNTPRKKNTQNSSENKLVTPKSEMESLHQASSSLHPGVDAYHIDANGIQSCKVPSSLHRVSRGMVLKSCKDCMELPSEVSDSCWEVPPNSNIKKESSLDSSIPMPGLALQICILDPLEINVDRHNIEAIGLFQSLFSKPSSPKFDHDNNLKKECESEIHNNNNIEVVAALSNSEDASQSTTASTGFFSGLLYGRPEEIIHEEIVTEDSFESCMQPESISVMGMYLAQTIIRVHVMREDEDDRNLSFCYWQIDTQCLTIDHQNLATPKKTFSDLKLDIGRLVWDEHRGTNRKNLVSLGLRQHYGNLQRSDSNLSTPSTIDDRVQNKAPWPSTACALLDIPPPIESLAYKSREAHGLQLRFISNPSNHKSGLDQVSRSIIYVKLGLTTVDAEYKIIDEIRVTISEMMKNLTDRKKAAPTTIKDNTEDDDQGNENDGAIELKEVNEDKTKSPKPRSLIAYTIQVDGGNISLSPLVQVKLPMTRFSGEQSSLAGFSIESALGKVNFAYGSKEPRTEKGCLVLPRIAGLPENVRMHILLCLKDLSPLEISLNVKKEKNPFRRIKAVDKAMLKMAKKITRRASKASSKKNLDSQDSGNRRQRILTEIMKLDDGELTNLWSVHQRYQKKLAQKLRKDQGV